MWRSSPQRQRRVDQRSASQPLNYDTTPGGISDAWRKPPDLPVLALPPSPPLPPPLPPPPATSRSFARRFSILPNHISVMRSLYVTPCLGRDSAPAITAFWVPRSCFLAPLWIASLIFPFLDFLDLEYRNCIGSLGKRVSSSTPGACLGYILPYYNCYTTCYMLLAPRRYFSSMGRHT